MKSARGLVCAGLTLLCTTLSGQAPQIPAAIPAQAPPVDLSGYWSPVLHEDLMERGAGSELADYGGFPLNEAGRLWAQSMRAKGRDLPAELAHLADEALGFAQAVG